METVEHMRKWLTDMSFDEWEAVSYDTREDYYADAWEFWSKHAPVEEVSYAYGVLKEAVDRAHLEEMDEEEDDD